jgi:hypothetical protein
VKLELGKTFARRNGLEPVVLNLSCDLSDECGEVFILDLKVHRNRVHRGPDGDAVKVWMTPEEFAELLTEVGQFGILAGLSDSDEE